MEARKQLAIVASHLRPTTTSVASNFTTSSTSSSSDPSPAGEGDANCVFYKIVRRQSHALVLYEDDVCLCIFDSNPLCSGHSLVIPKSHFSSLGTTPPSMHSTCWSTMGKLQVKLSIIYGKESIPTAALSSLLIEKLASQTHIHIIPCKTRDCLWASESLRRHTLPLDGTASILAESVREHLKFPDKKEDTKGQESCISKTSGKSCHTMPPFDDASG